MPIGRADLGFLPGYSAIRFSFLAVLFICPFVLLIAARRRWRMAAARAEEVRRLVWLAAEESARAEIEAASLAYAPPPRPPSPPIAAVVKGVKEERVFLPPPPLPPHCAVCYRHTTTRCARCKSVRYCSGKCQIIHWRRGHKDECHPLRTDDRPSGQEFASKLKGIEIDQSNPCENSSELDGKFPTKPVESLSERPPSESKSNPDVFHENDSNGTNPFSDASGKESTSDFFVDSSSLSSSSSSSSSSSLPPSTSSFPPQSSDDASTREDSGTPHYAKVGKASSDNIFPDYSRATSNGSDTKLTRVPLSQFDSARLAVNNSSCTSNIEQMVSTCKAKYEECSRSSVPEGTAFVGSDSGTHSGFSKDALKCEVDRTHLNSDSSHLNANSSLSKMTTTERSSLIETCSHRSTLSGGTTQSNLKDFKAMDIDKSNPFSGRCNDECLGKFKALKPQSPLSSVHHEFSSGSRRSVSHSASPKIDVPPMLTSKSSESIGFAPNGIADLKTSVRKVVQQLKSSQLPERHLSAPISDVSCRYKMLFPYDLFVKLYNCEKVELHPCGLTNCGNSCYANAVLQCLAFTRPLTSYLLQGFHFKTCTSREWCFTCEFGSLLAKSKQGQSPVSPIGVLSHIQNIGSNLGHGREEDAHEFLRYAIDTMQTVCLKEAGAHMADILAEETTIIQLIFGGYLRSKIKCTRCRSKSERRERMMDLTVEIHGDIGTLKDALARFTATEILDGENKYQCNRCKSYERAKKKLSVLEAPNVLTIALKRFQSGKFGKLNKAVRFPEHLDLAPYMSGTDDKSPVYSLYAVVVHQDIMNAAFSGHYICYVKSTQGKWYKTDDSKVKPVEIERVLAENAYMLLYARCSPRAPSLIRDSTSHDHLRSKKNRHKESFLSGPQLRSQDRPPCYPHHRHSSCRPSDLFKERLPFPETDSCSDCSSLSYSDEVSCSTESTRDSSSTDEYSDYKFGDSGRFSWSQSSGFSEDSDSLGYSPLTARHSAGESESLSYGERLAWERGEGLISEGRGRPRFLYSNTTNQSRKLTEENRERETNELMRSSTTRQRRAHEFY